MAYGSGQNAPYGLIPIADLISTTDSGQSQTYAIASGYATSLFAGDRVALSNGTLVIAPAGTPAIGVLQQVSYIDTNGNPVKQSFWPANTVTQNALVATAWVYDDPMLIYDVQVSNSANVANPSIIQTMVGQNANLAVGAGGAALVPQNPTSGSTVTGQSAYYLDFSTLNTDSTLDVKIIGLTPKIGNAFAIPFNSVRVQLNNDVYKSVGVGNNIDSRKVTSVTASGGTYVALLSDEVIEVSNTSASAETIQVPTAAASNRGKQFVIKDTDNASTHNITISAASGNIDGGSITINAQYGKATVFSDGAHWWTI